MSFCRSSGEVLGDDAGARAGSRTLRKDARGEAAAELGASIELELAPSTGCDGGKRASRGARAVSP